MTTHVVMFKPRHDLSEPERRELVDAFRKAVGEIPSVRGVRIGRRLQHGTDYERRMPDSADYFVAIDFDDAGGLRAYLEHPSHVELGARFNAAIATALIYDFDSMSLE